MSDRIETGACFCGAIAAEMHGEPFWICYDHDDDCRRAIGAPLSIWVGYRPDQFRLTRGTPKPFSRTKGVIRTFCPQCGTSISYSDDGLRDELYLTIGFLDHPERFEPQAHAYWRMRLPALGLPTTFRASTVTPASGTRPLAIPTIDRTVVARRSPRELRPHPPDNSSS